MLSDAYQGVMVPIKVIEIFRLAEHCVEYIAKGPTHAQTGSRNSGSPWVSQEHVQQVSNTLTPSEIFIVRDLGLESGPNFRWQYTKRKNYKEIFNNASSQTNHTNCLCGNSVTMC